MRTWIEEAMCSRCRVNTERCDRQHAQRPFEAAPSHSSIGSGRSVVLVSVRETCDL